MANLLNYWRALRMWWADRPHWPGPPIMVIETSEETRQAFKHLGNALERLGKSVHRDASKGKRHA